MNTVKTYKGVKFTKESRFFADGSERVNSQLRTQLKSYTTAGEIVENITVVSGVEYDDFQRIETPEEIMDNDELKTEIIDEVLEDAINCYGMDLLAIEVLGVKKELNRTALKNYLAV